MLLEIKCNSQDAGTFFLSNEIGHASDIVVHQFSSNIINFEFQFPERAIFMVQNHPAVSSLMKTGLPG